MRNERAVIHLVVATGISSVVTQIITIREFLAQFSGNEFIIALILFNWLIIGGIGTLSARFTEGFSRQSSVHLLAWFSVCLSIMPCLQIFAIRFSRDIIFVQGSSVGFYPTLFYTFLMISPYVFLVGFILPYSLFVLRSNQPDYPGTIIYIADNLGDVTGGFIFSFILVYMLTPMQTLFAVGVILLSAVFFVFPSEQRYRTGFITGIFLSFCILLSGVFFEKFSLIPLQGKLSYYSESRYGRIEVHKNNDQYTLFEDGMPRFSTENVGIAEETIHFPIVQLDTPRQVLIISSESGMIKQLAKYEPEKIDYVELNPDITDVQFRFGLIDNISGLNVIHEDGRTYLKNNASIYDAIIVNVGDPETFQANRFFTSSFFVLAKNRLASDGVLSFSVRGFDNYLSEPERIKLSSLYHTVKDYFDHVVLLPGNKVFFICTDKPVATDIPESLSEKGIKTSYIGRYYYGNITDERIQQLNELIKTDAPKNTDLSPHLMQLVFSEWFSKFSTSPNIFLLFFCVASLIYLFFISAEEFVLFSTGCMTMGSEILVIFTFQIFFGYIYFQIGCIVTVFLAGLLPGAWFGEKLRYKERRVLIYTDVFLVMILGCFIFVLCYVGDRMPVYYYFIFGFVVSSACGAQFPAAFHIKGSGNSAVVQLFSVDLIGAAFGTVLVSVILIPYFGVIQAAVGLIILKLVSLAVVLLRRTID